MLPRSANTLYIRVSQMSFLAELFRLRKTTTDPQILAHVNIGRPNYRVSKLQTCISEMILDIILTETINIGNDD